MKHFLFSILLVLFSINIGLSQQDTLIFKYRRMAVDYQQSVKMAEKNLEGANSLIDAAHAGFLPRFDLDGNYTYFGTPLQLGITEATPEGNLVTNQYKLYFSLTQPVLTGGYLKNNKSMAIARAGVAHSYIGLSKQNTMIEADAHYLNVVAKKEVNLLIIEYRDAIGSFLDVIQDRVDEEIVGMNELYQTKVRYNDAQYEVIRSEKEFNVSLMGLNRLIGVPLETQSMHLNELLIVDWNRPEDNESSRVEKAIQKRPEVTLKENEVAMSMYNEKITASAYNPQLNIGAEVNYGAPSPELTAAPGGNYFFGARLSVPVFYWGEKKDNVFAIEKITEQSRLDLERTVDLIKLQVTSAHFELKQSQAQVDFSFGALDNASKNVDVMTDRYQEGLSSVLEVLDAQLYWQKSYLNYIEAKYDLNMAYSTYLKSMGELSESE